MVESVMRREPGAEAAASESVFTSTLLVERESVGPAPDATLSGNKNKATART